MVKAVASQLLSVICVVAVGAVAVSYWQAKPVMKLDNMARGDTLASTAPDAPGAAVRTLPVRTTSSGVDADAGPAIPRPERRPHEDVVPSKRTATVHSARDLARLRKVHAAAVEAGDGRRVFSPARPALQVLGPLGSKPDTEISASEERKTAPTAGAAEVARAPEDGVATVTTGAIKTNAGTPTPSLPVFGASANAPKARGSARKASKTRPRVRKKSRAKSKRRYRSSQRWRNRRARRSRTRRRRN